MRGIGIGLLSLFVISGAILYRLERVSDRLTPPTVALSVDKLEVTSMTATKCEVWWYEKNGVCRRRETKLSGSPHDPEFCKLFEQLLQQEQDLVISMGGTLKNPPSN